MFDLRAQHEACRAGSPAHEGIGDTLVSLRPVLNSLPGPVARPRRCGAAARLGDVVGGAERELDVLRAHVQVRHGADLSAHLSHPDARPHTS
jgi:hypothetical protein